MRLRVADLVSCVVCLVVLVTVGLGVAQAVGSPAQNTYHLVPDEYHSKTCLDCHEPCTCCPWHERCNCAECPGNCRLCESWWHGKVEDIDEMDAWLTRDSVQMRKYTHPLLWAYRIYDTALVVGGGSHGDQGINRISCTVWAKAYGRDGARVALDVYYPWEDGPVLLLDTAVEPNAEWQRFDIGYWIPWRQDPQDFAHCALGLEGTLDSQQSGFLYVDEAYATICYRPQ